jgi:RNA polymerase sigma-70 factor (ECF subfamily)
MPEPTLPTDRELIEGIRSGDSEVLERLMGAFWSPLVRYAGRIVGEGSDPQDVVQEAFIRLWARRERWNAEGSVRSLLYTVTRNAALDERRRRARGARVARAAAPPPPPPAPSEEAVAEELARIASRAVSALPPKRQEVFRLSREEGLTYAEIASVMDVSPQTVANQMSLALSDLRRALAPHLDTAGSDGGAAGPRDW